MTENLLYLCRLCLKKSEFEYSVFTGNIPEQIESLTSIKIQEDDKLPKTCCESCLANIYTSYKFQQCIIKSDRILREKLFQNESHIIELAKQTPDLFEVLHLEGTSDSTDLVEPKLENLETYDKCENLEYVYKVEDVEIPFEQSNMSDDQILNNLLENTNSIKDDGSPSNDLCNENDMEYIDVDNFVDTVTTCTSNDSESVSDINKLYNEMGMKDLYKRKLHIYKEKQKSISEDNSHADNAENIFAKLGIQNKFLEKFAAYREKQKVNQTTLECSDCDMKFDTKRMLQRHMMKHKIDKCPFCSITMRSDNLKRHIQIHTDSPEICDICGKIAKNKESLRGHLNYHHKNSGTIKCEPCNKEFKSNHHYKTHVKKIHLGIRNHQCHICGKKFFANHDLNKHINMTHRGARPYVCQYCKKGFSSPYARKTHIRQHTLETPYRCEICAAGFRQKVSLVTHLKSKHSVIAKNKDISKDVA